LIRKLRDIDSKTAIANDSPDSDEINNNNNDFFTKIEIVGTSTVEIDASSSSSSSALSTTTSSDQTFTSTLLNAYEKNRPNFQKVEQTINVISEKTKGFNDLRRKKIKNFYSF
jgi:hypothetical protein